MTFAHLPYRSGVGILLANKHNHIFIAKRIDMTSEAWQMPQGGIDEGESPRDAALRELLEETGTNKAHIIHESADWYEYDLPDDLVSKVWKGRYRGQRQKWFLMRFLGEDNDINIETDNPEFMEWRWVEASALPDVIVPFKRALYKQLVEDFRHFLD